MGGGSILGPPASMWSTLLNEPPPTAPFFIYKYPNDKVIPKTTHGQDMEHYIQ